MMIDLGKASEKDPITGGGGGKPPDCNFREKKKHFSFLLRREKDVECSEMEKYVFC